MRSVLFLLFMLVTALTASAGEPAANQQPGIPVYAPRVQYEEVGRLYPAPVIVPTEWRHYQYRPTAFGRAVLGPWRTWSTPGPNMVYVPR